MESVPVFGDVDGSELARPVVDVTEEVAMQVLPVGPIPCPGDQTRAVGKSDCAVGDDLGLYDGEQTRVADSELVAKALGSGLQVRVNDGAHGQVDSGEGVTGRCCDAVAGEEFPTCGVGVDVPSIELVKNADRVGVEFDAFEPGIGDRSCDCPTGGLRGGSHPNILPGRFRSCLPWGHGREESARRRGRRPIEEQPAGGSAGTERAEPQLTSSEDGTGVHFRWLVPLVLPSIPWPGGCGNPFGSHMRRSTSPTKLSSGERSETWAAAIG